MIKRLSRLDIAMIELKKGRATSEDVANLIEHLKEAYVEIDRLEDELSWAETLNQ